MKVAITIAFIAVSIFGFLIKIPRPLQGHDKELHFLFYFLTSLFFNFLFKNRLLLISLLLFLFGVGIEYGQQLTNKFFHARYHGRFDKEDIKINVYGILAAFVIVGIIRLGQLAYKRQKTGRESAVNNPGTP